MKKNIINIGVLAHVDAGKTTLSESFLFIADIIKNRGNVDKGTSQLDYMDVEKERGISVRSATSTFFRNNVQINLIDTPGHIDFSSDVERSLRVLDAAILVISAVEGVQAHTENIWLALKKHKIPTIFFINKIDRIGADTLNVIDEIINDLSSDIIVMQKSINDGEANADILDLWNQEKIDDKAIESIANTSDVVLEKYLDGKDISFTDMEKYLKNAVGNFQLFPVMMGAAKNLIGVNELLDALVKYMPFANIDEDSPFSALVFKIDYDKKLGKIAGLRLFGGKLSNREIIKNATQKTQEKINQIKRYKAGKLEDIGCVSAGDIAAVSGLKNACVGDVLGNGDVIPENFKLNTPLLSVQVKAVYEKDYSALADALQILNDEDPALDFECLHDDKEFHLKIMGKIQIEVLEKILLNRFNIQAKFDDPTVIYKESPRIAAEGYARYWMPKPCWAIIKFKIEPGEPGSGIHYKSNLSVNDIHKKYQNEIERTIPKALKQGPKGWEVTDVKITLIAGEDHEIHTRPGDFVIATPMAIMNGLINTATKFLEPYICFNISAPEDLLGRIAVDIIHMRGIIEKSPMIKNGKFYLEGIVPIATSMDLPIKLSSRSGGKAKMKTHFFAYKECADEFGNIRPYKGISPLDEAKYILKARKALM